MINQIIRDRINQRGITLIVLVITIIVLLILASITINMVINGGIIGQADKAKEQYENFEDKDKSRINDVLAGMKDDKVDTGDKQPSVPPDWKESVSKIVDDVPIPKEFEVSEVPGENTKDGGLVIKGPDGSEFVWVPVPDISKMYDSVNKRGILYTFTAGRNSSPITYSASGYREPDVVVGAGAIECDVVESNLVQAGMPAGSTVENFKTQLQSEFEAMIASVSKYGGFYIGRYETGNLSQATVVSKKGNTDITNQTWYTMYSKQKAMYSGSSSVVSGMVWGSQWDATLNWMNTNPANGEYVTDSRGKGNYEGTSGNDTWSEVAPAGAHHDFRVNNIYDMAGNVWDWVLEATFNHGRVICRW